MNNNAQLIIYLDIFAFLLLAGFFALLFKSSSPLENNKGDTVFKLLNQKMEK
tara:strand:+ start:1225 stop:1380 length:156 start_codon:yes stop_codon:yes gene_type:complete